MDVPVTFKDAEENEKALINSFIAAEWSDSEVKLKTDLPDGKFLCRSYGIVAILNINVATYGYVAATLLLKAYKQL